MNKLLIINKLNEYEKRQKLKKSWNISHKYSTILLNNLEKINYEKIMSIYGSFIIELKSQNLEHKNKKYVNCWETMINTYNNAFKTEYINEKKIRGSIKQLNYVSYINSNK